MSDPLPGSLESAQDADFVLGDTEPASVLSQGGERFTECQVCLLETFSRARLCCQMAVCDACLQRYIRGKVGQRVLCIRCPNPDCCAYLSKEEIQHRLCTDMNQTFLKFLQMDNSCPNLMKTCPRCNNLAQFDRDVVISKNETGPDDQKVACVCGMVWCYRCQAPWHEHSDTPCKQEKPSDWLRAMRERRLGQSDADRCPRCQLHMQRSSSSDNLTCVECHMSFCHRCGKRMHRVKCFGSHHSRFSIFGCKYRLLPRLPVIRKLIRGTIFGCKVALLAPLVIPLALLVVLVVVPLWLTCMYIEDYRLTRADRRHRAQNGP